jgi:hypothetical protein
MAVPANKIRLGQLKEDVEGLYAVTDRTRTTVTDVRETQTDHGRRLSDVQWPANLTMLRMNSIDCRMVKVEGALQEHNRRLGQVDGRLDELEKGRRELAVELGVRFEGLDSKMDKVLALLSAKSE